MNVNPTAGGMRRKIHSLIESDPLALQLIDEAANAFQDTKADRDLLRRTKAYARNMAEDFLNACLARGLSAAEADELVEEPKGIRIQPKVAAVSDELKETYRCLGIIREYSGRFVEMDYPQCLADPLILRAYTPETISQVASKKGIEVGHFIRVLSQAQQALALSQDDINAMVVPEYTRLSSPLLLQWNPITATKVYFMGPVFYANAGDRWSLTFSTGSGLPDPLEWNGSLWYCKRYAVAPEALAQHGVGDKNPFRSLNFSADICNPAWPCKRLYIWQESKTALQCQSAYRIALKAGNGELYLGDAVKQLIHAFSTPNLKILGLDSFPSELRLWTRVSPADVMLSARPDTAEARIAHGLWVRPGFRLSDTATAAILAASAPLLLYTAQQTLGDDALPLALSAMAVTVLVEFMRHGVLGSEKQQQTAAMRNARRDLHGVFKLIWADRELSSIIKQSEAYGRERALAVACHNLSRLLGTVSTEELTEAYRTV